MSTWSAVVTPLAILSALFGGALQAPQNAAQVRILSPGADTRVTGPATIRVVVEPEGAATSVVFFVDGRQVCSVSAPPFECFWDSGPILAEHQVRAVANLGGGARIAQTVRTQGPDTGSVPAGVPTFSAHVEAVQLTVTVADGDRFTSGIPQSAFHVFEDGVAQPLASFAAEDVPLDLVVAVDISGSMAPAMPKLKAAVKEFLSAIPARTNVTVLAFNDAVFEVANPSTRRDERAAAIDRLAAHGPTSLYDVVTRGIDLVERRAGRKALIVFTDGEDEGSRSSVDEVERRLQSTDATLYMIGQGRGVELEQLKTVMKRLAAPTGGRALFTNKIDELRGAFSDLLSELSHQYLLGYTPTNTNHDGRWRRIKVDVDGHRQVRARQGYRAAAGS